MGNVANSVKNNMTAMFADRNMNISKSLLTKSTEKLSSGYRVNRSADDAAGLSISEQTRRLARGLSKGSENIKEGISLARTAEGALAEVEDILQRMNQLTVKGLNGTLMTSDRRYIQDEIDRLTAEIHRVGETTEFNNIPILQGENLEDLNIQHSADAVDNTFISLPDLEKILKDGYVKYGYSNIEEALQLQDYSTNGPLNYQMIDVIKDLINGVSAMRVNIGAQENKLEHALNSNGVKEEAHIENETKQRDLDVASEMVNFSCRSVASQAGESMMAQSTKINNTVLKMLP